MEVLENFKKEVASGFVIVDFYANWCGDCVRIEPILKELSKDYKIHKINIDENENLMEEFSIKRIPTLIFFKDGKELSGRLIEPKSKQEILNKIKEFE